MKSDPQLFRILKWSAGAWLLCIGAFLLFAVPLDVLHFVRWSDQTPRGPLPNEADWPELVQELHADLANAEVDVESFSVFLLRGQPGHFLSTVVCRMNSSPAAMDILTTHLDLKPTVRRESKHWAGNEVFRYTDTDWWVGVEDNTAEYFVSNNLIVGEEGDQWTVAHDISRSRIFIHYYFNF